MSLESVASVNEKLIRKRARVAPAAGAVVAHRTFDAKKNTDPAAFSADIASGAIAPHQFGTRRKAVPRAAGGGFDAVETPDTTTHTRPDGMLRNYREKVEKEKISSMILGDARYSAAVLKQHGVPSDRREYKVKKSFAKEFNREDRLGWSSAVKGWRISVPILEEQPTAPGRPLTAKEIEYNRQLADYRKEYRGESLSSNFAEAGGQVRPINEDDEQVFGGKVKHTVLVIGDDGKLYHETTTPEHLAGRFVTNPETQKDDAIYPHPGGSFFTRRVLHRTLERHIQQPIELTELTNSTEVLRAVTGGRFDDAALNGFRDAVTNYLDYALPPNATPPGAVPPGPTLPPPPTSPTIVF